MYKRKQVLFHQGDKAEHLFLILGGSIKIHCTSEHGDEAILQLLHLGDTFMETYIFLDAPVPISAQAIAEATILAIPAPVVRELASTDFDFSQVLLNVISKHYRDAILKIDSILLRSPVERIARYLLAAFVESTNTQKTFKLPFQKLLIAQYLGMKPETLSRAFVEVKKLGIQIKRDEITLPTPFSLCHFCDMYIALKCKNIESLECKKNEHY